MSSTHRYSHSSHGAHRGPSQQAPSNSVSGDSYPQARAPNHQSVTKVDDMTLEAWSLQAAAAERSGDRGSFIRLTSLIDRGMEPLPTRGPENYLGMSYNPNIHGPLKCIPFKVEDATTNLGLVFWDTQLGKMQGVFYGYTIMPLDEAGGPQSDFDWRKEGHIRLYILDPINDELEPKEIQWSPRTLMAAAGQKILVKIPTRSSRSGGYKELVIMFPPEQSSLNRTLIVTSYEESH